MYCLDFHESTVSQIHQYMLTKAPPVPPRPKIPNTNEQTNDSANEATLTNPNPEVTAPPEPVPNPEPEQRIVEDVREVRLNAAAGRVRLSFSAGVRLTRRVPAAEVDEQAHGHNMRSDARTDVRVQKHGIDDRCFTGAAVALTVAIIILLVKKYLKSQGIVG